MARARETPAAKTPAVTLTIALAILTLAVCTRAQELPPLSHQIVGRKFDYTIQKGDNWIKLAAHFGVGAAVIAADNGVALGSIMTAGKTLRIDNRHVVPSPLADGIIINLPQRMLYFFQDGKLKGAYPAAVGRVAPQWRTPIGKFRIIDLREHPTWRVPDSIQQEMRANGDKPVSVVPPGPDNPLGDYWIGISLPSIGIHSTNSPLGIYGFHTHGCIRISPANAESLFKSVEIGGRGEVVYEPILLARTSDGRIFLEVNRDAYKRGISGIDYVRKLAQARHLSDFIDWSSAADATSRANGIARDVTASTRSGTAR